MGHFSTVQAVSIPKASTPSTNYYQGTWAATSGWVPHAYDPNTGSDITATATVTINVTKPNSIVVAVGFGYRHTSYSASLTLTKDGSSVGSVDSSSGYNVGMESVCYVDQNPTVGSHTYSVQGYAYGAVRIYATLISPS